jgi:TP901 family phage tail tape measure protein
MTDNLRVAQRVGAGMLAVGAGMALGFNKSLRTYADFEHVMKTLELVTGASNEQLQKMDAIATQLGTNTIFSPLQVASGMEYLAKAGFKANDILGGTIQAVTYLGAALDKEIGGKNGVADQMTHIMQGFNIKPKGAMMVADMLAKTALSSSSDLEDIHEALKYVSSTAVDLDIGLDETLAMIAKLSNAGLRGGIGGRSLNNMLLQLSSSMGQLATPKHQKVLQVLGLTREDIIDSTGTLKPMVQVIDLLDKKLKKLTPIDRISTLNALMNIRGARAVGPLLRDTGIGGSFSDILAQVRGSSGAAQEIALKRMETLWGTFERLKDTVWNFFKTIGQVLKPVVQPLLNFFIKIVAKLTQFVNSPWGRPFVILAAGLSLALMLGGAFLLVFSSIKLMTLASTVTMANFGRTLALAWNQGTAAALRYATTSKGAMLVNTPFGPRWRGAGGRFVKGPTGMLGGGGMMANIGKFMTNLFGITRGFGLLGTALRIVLGPVGAIVGILGVLIGFKTMVKLITFGLGTFLNFLVLAGQMLWAIVKNVLTPWNIGTDMVAAKTRFKEAQNNMLESMGMKTMGGTPKPAGTQGKTIGLEEFQKRMDENNRQTAGFKKTAIQNVIQVNGKTLVSENASELEKQLAASGNRAFE